MRLALEIPEPHLEEFSKLTDVDFALAHRVLESKPYAEFYAEQRKRGRRVILDNGMHENGASLTVPEIIEAAKLINPSCVIPPDRLGDAHYTLNGFDELRKNPQLRWEPVCVVQGTDSGERVALFSHCRQYTNTLCLPYREPRSEWMRELVAMTAKHTAWPTHLHLLGVNKLSELGWFASFTCALQYAPENVTVDTAKPLKWAMQGKKLDTLDSLRGGGLLDHSKKMTIEQRLLAFYNIAYLRTYMA